MSQTTLQNHEHNLMQIKHPWQPDWVRTGEDMNTFLKLLDEHKHLSKREEDWYPPFIYIVDNTDGEERLSCFPSAWNGNYDPVEHGIENPLNVIEKSLNKKMAKKKTRTIQEFQKAVSRLEKAKIVNYTTHPHLRKSVGNSLETTGSQKSKDSKSKKTSQSQGKEHIVISSINPIQLQVRSQKEQNKRKLKLRQIIEDMILRPKDESRVLLYHDMEVQFPELTTAYHLIKDNDQYVINVVAVPKWVMEMTESYDDSKSDEYLLTLQELEAGVFHFDGKKYNFIESEGWGLHDDQRKAFKQKLSEIDLSDLADSIIYENTPT